MTTKVAMHGNGRRRPRWLKRSASSLLLLLALAVLGLAAPAPAQTPGLTLLL